ncbi:phosphatase PAP2 family protein [Succinivibrio sp.]|uniref:phosphatase PAP2 family protein n=1 Tax=Succinivibrio sp. TaxID=2053619 RepID=UPI0025F49FD5|nr:phosphatase PAP2 family protein [Succinivibrio sp.]MBQ9221657.1 phosphatase PAP2 family protein [Succinivibrio sp.]
MIKKLLLILGLNLLGVLLFFSWFHADANSFWPVVDKSVFFTFNHLLGENEFFRYLVAFTNLRFFDVFGFLAMALVFLFYFLKHDKDYRRFMICMGITMLLTAVIAKQVAMTLDFDRPSPTLHFSALGENVLYVSKLTEWPAKDWSKSCFPGDHGMCLIIFCVYMLRYFGLKSFLAGLLITVLFSLPRVMSGAHWVSDIAVGAVTVNLVVLSWILLTPVSDFIIASLMKLLRWKMPSSVLK